MLAIIEKVKDLIKCTCEKKEESAPPQEQANANEQSGEQTQSSEESGCN